MENKNIFLGGDFWKINKEIAELVGIESSVLLAELIERYNYYQSMGTLIKISNEPYFYMTGIEIQKSTTLSSKIQKRCIAQLKEAGFIKTVLKGIPAKLHFTICEGAILEFLGNGGSIATDKPKKDGLLYVFPSDFTEQCRALFMDFVAMRTEIKKPIKTQKAIDMLIEELSGCSTDGVRIETIQASIKNEWSGLFPAKFEKTAEPEPEKGRFQELEEASKKAFERNLEKLKQAGLA